METLLAALISVAFTYFLCKLYISVIEAAFNFIKDLFN